MKELRQQELLSSYSKDKIVAYVFVGDMISTGRMKEVIGRLELAGDSFIMSDWFQKECDSERELKNFINSFRSESDLNNYYVCGYNNGFFVDENT